MKKSIATLSLLATSSALTAATCSPTSPAKCYQDDCTRCYCLGPAPIVANAPVCPKTCDGDFFIDLSGFYWNAHQDGLEYSINNGVIQPFVEEGIQQFPTLEEFQEVIEENNNVIEARYNSPNFRWNFGFKLGVGYCMACDGWDIGATWTWYRGRGIDSIETESTDNNTLLALWSQFTNVAGILPFATQVDSNWDLQLNLIDIELGRQYWASRYLTLRPHIGLRIASLDQTLELHYKGGSWSPLPGAIVDAPEQPPLNNTVLLENDFSGVGVRAGLDSNWNISCGFALYGNLAASIVYGRFDVDHTETNREATDNHDKTTILSAKDHFKSSKGMLDLGLGVQWSAMLCECKYGLLVSLGWEQHLFFNQNQLWRVTRVGAVPTGQSLPVNLGQNVYEQRRGSLDTQGLTLKLAFDF